MEQYTSATTETPQRKGKASSETKNIQSLETKIATLETVIHGQGSELLKLRRDITRLKSDIEQLTSVIRRG